MAKRRGSVIERVLKRIEDHVEEYRAQERDRGAELWAEGAERQRLLAEALVEGEADRASFLLFGTYPGHRDGEGWWELRRRVLEARGGAELDVSEAWRVWGERFFPVAPSRRAPRAGREFVGAEDLPRILGGAGPADAIQGTVSRSGETLLLTLGDDTFGHG